MTTAYVTASLQPGHRAIAQAVEHLPGTFLSLNEDHEPGYFYFDADLVHEGANGNGHIFTAAEIRQSWRTLLGTQVDVDHEFTVEAAVGKVYAVRLVEEPTLTIRIAGYVSETHYPKIVWKMRTGIITGLSMECNYTSSTRSPDGLVLHGVQFIGIGIVRTPADSEARVRPNATAVRTDRMTAITRYAACLAAMSRTH